MRWMLNRLFTACAACLSACDSTAPNPPGGGEHPLVPGRIAFWLNDEGNIDIYSVADGGTGRERITAGPASDREPSWWPAGLRAALIPGGVEALRSRLIDE